MNEQDTNSETLNNEPGTEDSQPACKFCQDKKYLNQLGIMKIYLFPFKVPLILIVVGVILSLLFSPFWLILSGIGYVIPLANADLRLLLYPFVAIISLFGKKANCPKCGLSGSIFV